MNFSYDASIVAHYMCTYCSLAKYVCTFIVCIVVIEKG